ncbi:hypothetical protein B0T22DRAFT_44599 [Podospora appendiculata]|uniref:Fucose-specific lectin n=1 Tax=Podospora appendiculata TaxID=314037 RepID=A0AAE0XHY7_9PEZI|nr:hypothetical protein B0T22DRAFT_44599 [Podospora appendiculata]
MAPLSSLLLLATAISPAYAAIASWWTDIGPQVILQNATTGAIRYSACNSYDSPAYSPTDGSALSLIFKPKAGTPLAGAGWWDETTTTASIYYVNEDNFIVNCVFVCDMSTGLFNRTGSWIVSGPAPSVANNTGLAVTLLGSTAGYRLYYHDETMTVNELSYTVETNWEWHGQISQDPQLSPAIHAAFSGTNNITVVTARDQEDIEVIRLNSDNSWRIATLPHTLNSSVVTNQTPGTNITINQTAPANFSLTSWTGSPGGLGISIDQHYTRSIWYIGNDSSLYSVANKNYVWSPQANQSNAYWPIADSPNAELSVTSDFKSSTVRIYYLVNKQVAEIKYEDDVWKGWATLQLPKLVTTSPIPSTPSSLPAETSAASNAGLSAGAKAGLGVGITLGVLALLGIGAAIFLVRRRKAALAAGERVPIGISDSNTAATSYGSPDPRPASAAYDNYMWEKKNLATNQFPTVNPEIYQLDASQRPTELAAPRPMYELPDQSFSHELSADTHSR